MAVCGRENENTPINEGDLRLYAGAPYRCTRNTASYIFHDGVHVWPLQAWHDKREAAATIYLLDMLWEAVPSDLLPRTERA